MSHHLRTITRTHELYMLHHKPICAIGRCRRATHLCMSFHLAAGCTLGGKSTGNCPLCSYTQSCTVWETENTHPNLKHKGKHTSLHSMSTMLSSLVCSLAVQDNIGHFLVFYLGLLQINQHTDIFYTISYTFPWDNYTSLIAVRWHEPLIVANKLHTWRHPCSYYTMFHFQINLNAVLVHSKQQLKVSV